MNSIDSKYLKELIQIIIEYTNHMDSIMNKYSKSSDYQYVYLLYTKNQLILVKMLKSLKNILNDENERTKIYKKYTNRLEDEFYLDLSTPPGMKVNYYTSVLILKKIKEQYFIPILETLNMKDVIDIKKMKKILVGNKKLGFLLSLFKQAVFFPE